VFVVLQPEFDALEALRCEGLQPPNPRVRPLDNLNKCLSILPQVGWVLVCLLVKKLSQLCILFHQKDRSQTPISHELQPWIPATQKQGVLKSFGFWNGVGGRVGASCFLCYRSCRSHLWVSLCENHAPRNRLQPNSEPRSNKSYAVPSWCTLIHSQMCISLLHFSSEPQTLKASTPSFYSTSLLNPTA
jgi:hypothetical protein